MEKEKKIEILQDLIRIKSVNNNEEEVALYIKNLLASYDIDADLVEYDTDRSNLIVEVAGAEAESEKTLAFSGHFDVVDVGDEADWSYPPFEAEIADGYMYGRGTADMKAGVAAMIIAIIELKEEGLPFSGKLRFLGSVGEEIGMLGSVQLTEEGYTEDIDALIIAEPTDNIVIYAHKGSLQYEIVSIGRSAHSSLPQEGINALSQMTEFLYRAEKALDEKTAAFENDKLGPMTNSFTVIEGGEQINSIPSKVSVLANARTIPEFDNDDVIQLLNEIIEELNQEMDGKLELNITQSMFPVESSADSDLIHTILDVAGEDLEVKTLAGATDASNFMRVDHEIELAIFSPFVYSEAHTVDEKIKVEDYLSAIDTFKNVALQYLN